MLLKLSAENTAIGLILDTQRLHISGHFHERSGLCGMDHVLPASTCTTCLNVPNEKCTTWSLAIDAILNNRIMLPIISIPTTTWWWRPSPVFVVDS